MQQDRSRRSCGQELMPEDQFCAGCGRPAYATAHVPTSEADVSVPPPPQQTVDSSVLPQVAQAQSDEELVRSVTRANLSSGSAREGWAHFCIGWRLQISFESGIEEVVGHRMSTTIRAIGALFTEARRRQIYEGGLPLYGVLGGSAGECPACQPGRRRHRRRPLETSCCRFHKSPAANMLT